MASMKIAALIDGTTHKACQRLHEAAHEPSLISRDTMNPQTCPKATLSNHTIEGPSRTRADPSPRRRKLGVSHPILEQAPTPGLAPILNTPSDGSRSVLPPLRQRLGGCLEFHSDPTPMMRSTLALYLSRTGLVLHRII